MGLNQILFNIKLILTDSDKFISRIDKDTSYVKPWLYYGLSYIFLLIFTMIILIPYLFLIPIQIMLFVFVIGIIQLIMGAIQYLIIPFITTGFAHLGLLIFSAKKGYFNTFKPWCYGAVINMVYNLFSIIIILVPSTIILFTFFKQYGFNPEILPASSLFLISIFIIIGSLVMIAGFVHSLIFRVKAIAHFQGISKTRAFFGMILIPAIIYIGFFFFYIVFILIMVAVGEL